MSETDSIIFDTAQRIFEDLSTAEVINAAEDGQWPDELWQAIEEAGLALTWIPEVNGGVGASLMDGFAVIKAAGAAALPVPLAESLLAGWLLAKAGLEVGTDPMTIVLPEQAGDLVWNGERLSGTVSAVPHARSVRRLVVVVNGEGGQVLVVDPAQTRIESKRNLAGEPWDTVTFDGVEPLEQARLPADTDLDRARAAAALMRCVQAAGALGTALELTIQYAMERVQFGRPIAKFQALQHSVAAFAGEVAAINAAADAAAEAMARNNAVDGEAWIEIAAAKTRLEEAVNEGAAVAHQVHGAMGFTYEHRLHHLTRRLWAWRDEYGSDVYWSRILGQEVLNWGADQLWPRITAVSDPR